MNPKVRYIAHFAVSHEDAREVGSWRHLEDAKKLCEREFEMDFFGSPRVYVEELTVYPEDEIHERLVSWDRVGFYEFDGYVWHNESLEGNQ